MTILFDLDGTLTDPYLGISRCIRHAMDVLGSPLAEDADLRWCVGPPLLGTFERLLGADRQALAPQALEAYRQRFKTDGMFENKVYEGIDGILSTLSAKHALYVATSKPEVFAREILAHFGLAQYFRAIHGSQLDGGRSDKAELIAWILSEHGLKASNTLMVGDREHDMIGAAKNGLGAVGALWGYGTFEELKSHGAARILEHPHQLLELVLTD